MSRKMRPADPILTLDVGQDTSAKKELGGTGGKASFITSVCFLASKNAKSQQPESLEEEEEEDEEESGEDDSTSSSDEGGLQLRCQAITQQSSDEEGNKRQVDGRLEQMAAQSGLFPGRFLVSCHSDGSNFIWSLEKGKVVQDFSDKDRGPGLVLRRIGDSTVMYQTRDEQGTVSLHAVEANQSRGPRVEQVSKFETFSQSFCSAAPCEGDPNLVSLPSLNETQVCIRDWRIKPSSNPVALFDACECASSERYGFLTSLSMCDIVPGRPVVACGMESGHLFFHDLRMIGTATPNDTCIHLGDDPILALDMLPSRLPGASKSDGSLVSVAGMGGDASTLADLEQEERGRVAVVKTSSSSVDGRLTARLRSRLSTCQIYDANEANPPAGKPGVSACRFRPDGRLFAVSGWDYRLRLFDRKTSEQIAILRGHSSSVRAVDWADDAERSGLLATAADDGTINVWRCFPSNHD